MSLSHPAASWKIPNEKGTINFSWSTSDKDKIISNFMQSVVNAIEFLNALGPFQFNYSESLSQASSSQKRIINIASGEGCYTTVGNQANGINENEIVCDAAKPGYGPSAVLHETMHKLGEGHAHQSANRDSLFIVNSEDIANYLDIYPSNLEPQDPFSIMQYTLGLQLQLRDEAALISYLQTLGLNQAAIDLMLELMPLMGKFNLASYFDIRKLLEIAYIIDPESTLFLDKLPLCGLIPGVEYNPQIVLKLLKLFTNSSYTASGAKILGQTFIEIKTQGCATINLVEAAQIPRFMGEVNCGFITNLPLDVIQQNCLLFLPETSYPFHQAYSIEFFTANTTLSSILDWKNRIDDSIPKHGNCAVIPDKASLIPPTKPLIKYPQGTQQKKRPLFNPIMTWQEMGKTFLASSVNGMTHAILSITLRKLQNKFKLGFCSTYVVSHLLNSLVSIIASWDSTEDANALNQLLKLIDENGFIYQNYTDGLSLENILTHCYPYAIATLSTVSLSYLLSKTPLCRNLLPGFAVTLSIFFSTLSATRNTEHLLKAFLASLAYLLGNASVCTVDLIFLNETKKTVSNIESATPSSQRSLTQESPNERIEKQHSVRTAFISAKKTVTPTRFYTALRNCFFKPTRAENGHCQLTTESPTPMLV